MQEINYKKNILWSTGLLAVPFLASFFIEGFNWDLFDYIFAFIFFFVAGSLYQFFISKTQNKSKKVKIGVGLTFLFVYIWAELAVGIFTNLGS